MAMKIKEKVAKTLAVMSFATAKKACGAASCWGLYQTKEPKSLAKYGK
jgi:cyclic lactone autoinducer peptide